MNNVLKPYSLSEVLNFNKQTIYHVQPIQVTNQSCRYYCTKTSGICKTVGLYFLKSLKERPAVRFLVWIAFYILKCQHAQEFYMFMFHEYHQTPDVYFQNLIRTAGLHALVNSQWWVCMKTKIKGDKKWKEIEAPFTSGSTAEWIFFFSHFYFLITDDVGTNILLWDNFGFVSVSFQVRKSYTTGRR